MEPASLCRKAASAAIPILALALCMILFANVSYGAESLVSTEADIEDTYICTDLTNNPDNPDFSENSVEGIFSKTPDALFNDVYLVVKSELPTFTLGVSVTNNSYPGNLYRVTLQTPDSNTESISLNSDGTVYQMDSVFPSNLPCSVSVEFVSGDPSAPFSVKFTTTDGKKVSSVESSNNVMTSFKEPVTHENPSDRIRMKHSDGNPNVFTFTGLSEAELDRVVFTVHGKPFGIQLSKVQNTAVNADIRITWPGGSAQMHADMPGFYSINDSGKLERTDYLVHGGISDTEYRAEVLMIDRGDLKVHLKPDSAEIDPDLTQERKDSVVFLDTFGSMTVGTEFAYPVENGTVIDPWLDGGADDPGFSLDVAKVSADGTTTGFTDYTVEYRESSLVLRCTATSSNMSAGDTVQARISYDNGGTVTEYQVMDVHAAYLPLADLTGFQDRPGPALRALETGSFGDAFTVILGTDISDAPPLSVPSGNANSVFSAGGKTYMTVLWPDAAEGDVLEVRSGDVPILSVMSVVPDMTVQNLSTVQNIVTELGSAASVPYGYCLKVDGGITVSECTASGIPGTTVTGYGGKGAAYFMVSGSSEAHAGDVLNVSVNGSKVVGVWFIGMTDIEVRQTGGQVNTFNRLMTGVEDSVLIVKIDRENRFTGMTLDHDLPYEVIETPGSVYIPVDKSIFRENALSMSVGFEGMEGPSVILNMYLPDMVLQTGSQTEQNMDADRTIGALAVIAFDVPDGITGAEVVKTGTRAPVGTVKTMGDSNGFVVVEFSKAVQNAKKMTLRLFHGQDQTDYVIKLADAETDLFIDTEIPVLANGANVVEDRYRDGKLIVELHETVKFSSTNKPQVDYNGEPVPYEIYSIDSAGATHDVITLDIPGGFRSGDSLGLTCTKEGEFKKTVAELLVFVPDVTVEQGSQLPVEVIAETGDVLTVKSYIGMSGDSFRPGHPVSSTETISDGTSTTQAQVHYGIVDVGSAEILITETGSETVICSIHSREQPTWVLDLSKSQNGTFMAEESHVDRTYTVRLDAGAEGIHGVTGFGDAFAHDGKHVYFDVTVPADRSGSIGVSGTVNGSNVNVTIRLFTPAWTVPSGTSEYSVVMEDAYPYQNGKSYIKFESVADLKVLSVTGANSSVPFVFDGSSYLPFILLSSIDVGDKAVFSVTADGTPAEVSSLYTGTPVLVYEGTPTEGNMVNDTGEVIGLGFRLAGKAGTVPDVSGGTLTGICDSGSDLYITCDSRSGTLTVSDGTGTLITLHILNLMELDMTVLPEEDFVLEDIPVNTEVVVKIPVLPRTGASPTCAEALDITVDEVKGEVSFIFDSFWFDTSVMTVPSDKGDVTARLHMTAPDLTMTLPVHEDFVYESTPPKDILTVKIPGHFTGQPVLDGAPMESGYIVTKDALYADVPFTGSGPVVLESPDGSASVGIHLIVPYHTVTANHEHILITEVAGTDRTITDKVVKFDGMLSEGAVPQIPSGHFVTTKDAVYVIVSGLSPDTMSAVTVSCTTVKGAYDVSLDVIDTVAVPEGRQKIIDFEPDRVYILQFASKNSSGPVSSVVKHDNTTLESYCFRDGSDIYLKFKADENIVFNNNGRYVVDIVIDDGKNIKSTVRIQEPVNAVPANAVDKLATVNRYNRLPGSGRPKPSPGCRFR